MPTYEYECETCRDELDTMEADLDWFLVLEAASRTVEQPAHAGGLNRVLTAARNWQIAHEQVTAAQEERRRGMEQQAGRALEIFFGPTVAAAVRSQGEPESAESLLSTFLGKRAADALITDIRRGSQPRVMAPDVS